MVWDLTRIAIFSIASIVALFFLTKMIGNRQVSQLSLFDYINGITIGSIAAEMATSLEKDALQPLLAMTIYALATWLVSILNNKSLKFRRFSMGQPIVLLEDGKLYGENIKKARLDLSEIQMQLRGMGYFNIDDVQTILMEPNGKLSILPRSRKRPVQPGDLNLEVPQERLVTNVILDGVVLMKNLRHTGNNEKWLENRLHELGISGTEKVFLATCDDENTLSVYLRVKDRKDMDIFT